MKNGKCAFMMARAADLNSARLKSTWTFMAVIQAASYISYIVPALFVVCVIVSLIVAIIFLVEFNRAKPV